MFLVRDLYTKYGTHLKLTLAMGKDGLRRRIKYPEANRPGLCLLGILSQFAAGRVLVFGKAEFEYLDSLGPSERMKSLKLVLNHETPAIFISRGYRGPKELEIFCRSSGIPLFRSKLSTLQMVSKLTLILANELAPITTAHGTLVEVFGMGVLIQGCAFTGKSETALGLIEKGHSLVADDVVRIRKREELYLEGYCPEHIRNYMKIRGIGIINIARLHGAVRVKSRIRIDFVVKLQRPDKNKPAPRRNKQCQIQGIKIPQHCVNVDPNLNLVSLVETIALNHQLQENRKSLMMD